MLKVGTHGAAEQADEFVLSLDDLAREGSRRMLAAALAAEAATYVERFRGEQDRTVRRWWFATAGLEHVE
jgi:hypothetical protein